MQVELSPTAQRELIAWAARQVRGLGSDAAGQSIECGAVMPPLNVQVTISPTVASTPSPASEPAENVSEDTGP